MDNQHDADEQPPAIRQTRDHRERGNVVEPVAGLPQDLQALAVDLGHCGWVVGLMGQGRTSDQWRSGL